MSYNKLPFWTPKVTNYLQVAMNVKFKLTQVQYLVGQPTLMRDLDQSSSLVFNAMEQKPDYRTVPTHDKILALTLLMLVLHVLVG